MFAASHLLIILIGHYDGKWVFLEQPSDLFFLVIGIFGLLMMGIFPSVFIGGVWKIFASLLTSI
jgi:hypothetical protein